MFIGRPLYIQQLNDITFWLPILEQIKMRTPKTKLFHAPDEIGKIVDGEVTGDFRALEASVRAAMLGFDGEAFLRTGQTSNKHEWKDTCHITENSKVGQHLANLIEFSMLVDIPYTTFAVRQMIKTTPITTAFRHMPIAREIRMFVQKGGVVCAHPYWPAEAFSGQKTVTKEQIASLQVMPDMTELDQMAAYVSRYFDGAWSVDFLQDSEGAWWLTDMALASASYHWPECPNAEKWPE